MLIEIISHCWAEQYPHFARALRCQMDSLIENPPEHCNVQLSVCYVPTDKLVVDTLIDFIQLETLPRSVTIHPYRMVDATYLGRRSIGRNHLAKVNKADMVWFTDVDHCFGYGCLDNLAGLKWPTDATMIYPRDILIHKDHATGDLVLSGQRPLRISDFVPKHYTRAIGGVQIVQGDFARKFGYLSSESRWQVPNPKPFGDFKDDIAYRRCCYLFGKIRGVELDGVFRIRHSTTTYQKPVPT